MSTPEPTEQEVIKRILDWVEEHPWKEQFEDDVDELFDLILVSGAVSPDDLEEIKPDTVLPAAWKCIVSGSNGHPYRWVARRALE